MYVYLKKIKLIFFFANGCQVNKTWQNTLPPDTHMYVVKE